MAKHSDAERKEWREKMNGLIKQVSGLSEEHRAEMARRMPIVTCEGHAISGFNHCFLSMQTDKAITIIGGFRQWERAGRTVSKGVKAAGYIYVPLKKKDTEGETRIPEKLRFRMVPVFDISQTEESAVAA
jgi:hypothetical protein